MTHGLESVTGALAILKSGAVYVPCDPGHPAERPACMISDSRCTPATSPSGKFSLPRRRVHAS
ncbi:hypothetical protein ACFXAE_14520 [Streptomyces sp. NPDC059454]|uniref:hypothetical protein n=1 Tax=Streptomyces sp. NPDC059454 TaxID=3346836 RepID=UPI00367E4624